VSDTSPGLAWLPVDDSLVAGEIFELGDEFCKLNGVGVAQVKNFEWRAASCRGPVIHSGNHTSNDVIHIGIISPAGAIPEKLGLACPLPAKRGICG